MELKKIGDVKFVEGGVCAAKGFKANGIQCGLVHAGATITTKKNCFSFVINIKYIRFSFFTRTKCFK